MKLDTRFRPRPGGGHGSRLYDLRILRRGGPGSTAAFFSYLLHVDLTGLARPISWGSFFTGLLGTGFVSALFAAAVVGLYNRLSKGEGD